MITSPPYSFHLTRCTWSISSIWLYRSWHSDTQTWVLVRTVRQRLWLVAVISHITLHICSLETVFFICLNTRLRRTQELCPRAVTFFSLHCSIVQCHPLIWSLPSPICRRYSNLSRRQKNLIFSKACCAKRLSAEHSFMVTTQWPATQPKQIGVDSV